MRKLRFITFLLITCFLCLLNVIKLFSDQRHANSKYNFMHPVRLRSGLLEALRLNELLAQIQYRCESLIKFPVALPNDWPSCNDSRLLSGNADNVVALSVTESSDSFQFEVHLLQQFPSAFVIILRADNDISLPAVLYPFGSKERVKQISQPWLSDGVSFWKNIQSFRRTRHPIQYFKLNCGVRLAPGNCFQVLSGLVHDLNAANIVQAIHLILRLDRQDAETLYQWYRLFLQLFYLANYVLHSSAQSGQCGRVFDNCVLQLSLLKLPEGASRTSFLAPAMGMGSPDEEFSRFTSVLYENSVNCEQRQNYCDDPVRRLCDFDSLVTKSTLAATVVSCIRVENSILHFELSDKNETTNIRNLNHHQQQHRLVPEDVSSLMQAKRKLLTFLKTMVLEHGSVIKMVLDVYGLEWEFLDLLLKEEALKTVTQLVVRTRVYFGEENENYRLYFSLYWRLKLEGFKVLNTYSGYRHDNIEEFVLNFFR